MAGSIAFLTDGVRTFAGVAWSRWRRPLAIAVAGALLVTGAAALTRTGAFRVRGIEVEGARHRSIAQIVRLSGVTQRDNAVWLDDATAEARLLRDPWVASADVRLDFPWTVTISVTERSPIASIRAGAFRALVAGDGTILGPGRAAGLPLIDVPPAWVDRGGRDQVVEAAHALSAIGSDLRSRVRRVTVGGPRGIELVLTGGLRVTFGTPGDYAAKTRVLEEVLTWIDRGAEEIRAIDVTAPSAPAVIPAG